MALNIVTLPIEILTQIFSPQCQDFSRADVDNLSKSHPLFCQILKAFEFYWLTLTEDSGKQEHGHSRQTPNKVRQDHAYNISALNKIKTNPSILRQVYNMDVVWLDSVDRETSTDRYAADSLWNLKTQGQMNALPDSLLHLDEIETASVPFEVRSGYEDLATNTYKSEQEWNNSFVFVDIFKICLQSCTNLVKFSMNAYPLFLSEHLRQWGIPPALKRINKLSISNAGETEFLPIVSLTSFFTIDSLKEICFDGVQGDMNEETLYDLWLVDDLYTPKDEWRIQKLERLYLINCNIDLVTLDDIISCPENLIDFHYKYKVSYLASDREGWFCEYGPAEVTRSLRKYQAKSLQSLIMTGHKEDMQHWLGSIGDQLLSLQKLRYLKTNIVNLRGPAQEQFRGTSTNNQLSNILPSTLECLDLSVESDDRCWHTDDDNVDYALVDNCEKMALVGFQQIITILDCHNDKFSKLKRLHVNELGWTFKNSRVVELQKLIKEKCQERSIELSYAKVPPQQEKEYSYLSEY